MIKIPESPFKITEFDETDPFIVNALKPRKHYDLCWCGSGKKYKKCHRVREIEKAYTIGKIFDLHHKVFWKKRGCMHPAASKETCSGIVIDSHTIQRKGPLAKIVDDTGHVMSFEYDRISNNHIAKKVGWKKASTFPGYCQFHDSSLFAPIEKSAFKGEHEQCVLHAFRNVCNELYRKTALIEGLEFQRSCIDRGADLHRQIELQLQCHKNIEAQKKSVEESITLRERFESAILNNDFKAFRSKCYTFTGNLDVVSTSAFQCEFDFDGNKLVDMWDLSFDAQILSHSIVDTEDGASIIFVWLADEESPEQVVNSFDKIPSDQKGDIFIQYCFVNCENTYFSTKWWEQLPDNLKSLLLRYAKTLYYEGGKYESTTEKLVDWKFS